MTDTTNTTIFERLSVLNFGLLGLVLTVLADAPWAMPGTRLLGVVLMTVSIIAWADMHGGYTRIKGWVSRS